MSHGSWIFINLVIIAARISPISEESYSLIFLLYELQGIPLIPSFREYIEGNLPSNRIMKT